MDTRLHMIVSSPAVPHLIFPLVLPQAQPLGPDGALRTFLAFPFIFLSPGDVDDKYLYGFLNA